jgi:hypothetical protein
LPNSNYEEGSRLPRVVTGLRRMENVVIMEARPRT